MSRTIRCERCNQNLGEIRDARLRKGIVYYCKKCQQNMKAQVASAAHLSKNSATPDFLKSIFGA